VFAPGANARTRNFAAISFLQYARANESLRGLLFFQESAQARISIIDLGNILEKDSDLIGALQLRRKLSSTSEVCNRRVETGPQDGIGMFDLLDNRRTQSRIDKDNRLEKLLFPHESAQIRHESFYCCSVL
jgi:hypothetical protein